LLDADFDAAAPALDAAAFRRCLRRMPSPLALIDYAAVAIFAVYYRRAPMLASLLPQRCLRLISR